MTDAERLEAIWAKLHGGSQVTADEIVFLESEHGKTVQSYHKALEERWAEIVELLAEVERLREQVKALAVFEDYVRRIEAEHYEVGGPHLPSGVYECICEADDCPELEAHDVLVADLKELNYVGVPPRGAALEGKPYKEEKG